MSMLVFPGQTIRGLGYPVKRSQTWENQIVRASSGAEVAISYWANPLQKWELVYDGAESGYLLDDPDNPAPMTADTDLAILQGFYNQNQGRFGIFLYDDWTPGTVVGAGPWDWVAGQPIATADGIASIYQLIRTIGGFTEVIQAPYTTPPPLVYDNGTPLIYGTDYTVDVWGRILFAAPPVAGHAITADFSYYWPVRFDEDNLDFENMMQHFWANKSVKLVQVRL
jgi:uncharacterized protein (TIGR02217 family)